MNEPELTRFNENHVTLYRGNNEFKTLEVKVYGNNVIVRPCILSKEMVSKIYDRVFIDINDANLIESINEVGTPYIARNWPFGYYRKFWGR